MRRLPSISTRTYTLFPYPTLVRSPEDLVEGRAVRDVEEADRADRPVQLDGIDARAERAVGDSPLVDPGDVIDGGHVEVPDRLGTVQVLAVVDVLDHHHADELLMLVMMVEGELDQPLQRLDWRQALGVELRLAFAHQPVGVLEGAQIEPLLVARSEEQTSEP